MTPLAPAIDRLDGVVIYVGRSGPPSPTAVGGAERFRGAGLGREGDAPPVCAADRISAYDLSQLAPGLRRGPLSGLDRPLAELVYAVLDTETTGLNPGSGDRILSVAAVRIRHGAVMRGERFDALVSPARAVPASSTRIHGITDAMVEAASPAAEVLPAFVRFLDGAVLVGHEIDFDLAFLEAEADRLGLPKLAEDRFQLDTLLLSRLLHSSETDHRLEAVAERLGVPVVGRHSALGDALIAAHVLVRMLALLGQRGIETFGRLQHALRSAGISA